MAQVSNEELNRQFRVLNQTIGIHSDLACIYKRRSLILDIILLVSSALLCATVFVDDSFFKQLGLNVRSNLLTGSFSLIVFIGSLISIKVDWKGLSARHYDAGQKLTRVGALFRKYRCGDGAWQDECRDKINNDYWVVCDNIIPIPSNKFVKFKSRYLRKVELSKSSSEHPGYSLWMLKICLLFYSFKNCCREKNKSAKKEINDAASNE
jgi:hypothetical protein